MLLFSEHPEDLGRVYREEDGLAMDPGSIWQWPEVRSLKEIDELQLFTVAFSQCCFGRPYRKPTRILTNIEELRRWGPEGWPVFDTANGYLGPLGQCNCNISVSLAKKHNNEGFKTSGTASYPSKMDEGLAQAIVSQLLLMATPTVGQFGSHDKEERDSKRCRKGVIIEESGMKEQGDHKKTANSGDGEKEECESKGRLGSPCTAVVGEQPREGRSLPEKEGETTGSEPILAYYKGKRRMIHDGGGLGSPGRWPVRCRRELKKPDAIDVASIVKREFLKWLLGQDQGGRTIFWKLAAGKVQGSPFEGSIEGARKALDEELSKKGESPRRRVTDRDSEINFRRIAAVGKILDGEDWEYLLPMAEEGVPLGVDEEMPRTPEVFEEKLKWAREFTEEELVQVWADNYESAEEGKKDIWRQVDEEVKRGAIVKMSEEDAKKEFGERLAVAALGAVPKELGSEKVRLIHDGSYSVDVNRRIKVRDRMRFPLIDNAAAILVEAKDAAIRGGGLPRVSLVYDVKKGA